MVQHYVNIDNSKTNVMDNVVIKPKQIMPLNYLASVKLHLGEICSSIFLGIGALFTLENATTLIVVIGSIGTALVLPWIFGWIRNVRQIKQLKEKHIAMMKREEEAHKMEMERLYEQHVSNMIRDLTGTVILQTDSHEIKMQKVKQFLNNINKPN